MSNVPPAADAPKLTSSTQAALVTPADSPTASAAWVDDVSFGASAAGGTFDIQARFASVPDPTVPDDGESASLEEWQDVGLPGDPDTFEDGYEIVIPPI